MYKTEFTIYWFFDTYFGVFISEHNQKCATLIKDRIHYKDYDL